MGCHGHRSVTQVCKGLTIRVELGRTRIDPRQRLVGITARTTMTRNMFDDALNPRKMQTPQTGPPQLRDSLCTHTKSTITNNVVGIWLGHI